MIRFFRKKLNLAPKSEKELLVDKRPKEPMEERVYVTEDNKSWRDRQYIFYSDSDSSEYVTRYTDEQRPYCYAE